MSRTIVALAASFIAGLSTLVGAAPSDFAGRYEGAQLSVVVTPDGTGYRGEIHLGDQTFPMTARADGDHLAGVFTSDGDTYKFTAARTQDGLTLVTDGNTYQMHRLAPVPEGAPAREGKAQSASDALANYTVLVKTDIGRSLVREIPNAKSTGAALQTAFPDLARYFGAHPTVLGAYEDHRDHRSAFVSFTAKADGDPVKGFVTTRLRDEGAVVFIVFGREDATREQWAELTSPPKGAGGERDIKAEMAQVPLTAYLFPDHTGAVGVAEGWTCRSPAESNSVITGPAGQRVRMAYGGTVYTPNSITVRRNQQLGGLNLAVAPYSTEPAVALANISKINSQMSGKQGGPTWTLDRIVKVVPVNARRPGGHASQITYDVTMNDGGAGKHYGGLIQFEMSPSGNEAWGYYVSLQCLAPAESFQKDLPVMLAQVFSLVEDPKAIAIKSKTEIDAANKRAKALLEANQKVAQGNYDRNKAIDDNRARQDQKLRDDERNEAIKMRSLTDFDETIRGERTIEDTQSGKQTSVNLADVHDIVDRLNEQDPGRFKEVPLRDQLYPLPGHENDPDYLPR